MPTVDFVLDGEQYTLSSEQIEKALAGAQPENVRDLAVAVNGQWWPVKQAFGAALGKVKAEFNSRRAFDILRRLEFEMHDATQDGERPEMPGARRGKGDSTHRVKALEQAVALLAGQTQDPDKVLAVAETFLGWTLGTN